MLSDATLIFQALERGVILLTRNISEMDLIEQLALLRRVLFYRQMP